jgi:hypothetical protein
MRKKRLTLSRETLLTLEAGRMTPVVGASGCATCADQTCGSCNGSCFESCTCDMSCWGSCFSCEQSCPCN